MDISTSSHAYVYIIHNYMHIYTWLYTCTSNLPGRVLCPQHNRSYASFSMEHLEWRWLIFGGKHQYGGRRFKLWFGVFVCMYRYVCLYVLICICNMYMYMYMCMCICICTCTCICMYVHVCMYIYDDIWR